MKSVFIGGVVVLITILGYWLFSNTAQQVTNYPGDGTTIVAFGDSLIAGVGATAGNDVVSVLSEEIGEPIINLGVPGDTTADALLRLDEVIAKDPKLVIVLLGGNDYLRKVADAETFANLQQIIGTIHQSGSMVVLLGVRGGVLRDNYAAEFESLAENNNTAYVSNVLQGLLGRPELMADAVHPNDQGYALMAQRVLPVLQPLLDE